MHTLGKTNLDEKDFTLGINLYLRDIIKDGYYNLSEGDLKMLSHAIRTEKKAANSLLDRLQLNNEQTREMEKTINLLD